MTDLLLRPATPDDAEGLHALVHAHEREGHLLPREPTEIRRHAARFVVCERLGQIQACAELAPLSSRTAEVRSLVVSAAVRRNGLASRLIDELRDRARTAGFETLCAFTHDARFFVEQGFSIVPHMWVPEKIASTCVSCPIFRRCGQYAMVLPLRAIGRVGTGDAAAPCVAVA